MSLRVSTFLAAVLISLTTAMTLVAVPQNAVAADTTSATAVVSPAPAAGIPSATDAAATTPSADAKEEVNNPYGLKQLWEGGDFVARGTLIILLIMSMGSWYIIITKLIDQIRVMSQAKEARNSFWKAASVQDGIETLQQGSPFRFIAETGAKSAEHHEGALLQKIDLNTWVTMSIQRSVEKVQSRLQDGLAFLATAGSTAPFIGLFGTVWGIYHALTAIGIAGQASIDKVAGPVGEALIMTAIGLAVAVPAVLGYNWLVRRNKAVMEDVRAFSSDLHAVLLSGAMSASEAGRAVNVQKIG
jgi:biopolymer transport protein ExbB